MLDQVSTLTDVIEAIKEIDLKVIRNAVWRGTLSCLGSAVQLEIRRATEEDPDTSAYDARVTATQWVISNANVPSDIVREEALGAYDWLRSRKENAEKGVDLDDLKELGLDAETIEAGRKLAARWDKSRSEERTAIVESIGRSVIDEICAEIDQYDLEPGALGLVVDMLGKAVHSAMIGATARVEAASWSPRRKAEAISTLAGLVATRDLLENIEVVDARDLVSADREIW